MIEPALRRNSVILVVVALMTALVVRSLIQLGLGHHGFERTIAADLSYLAVPPVLLLLTVPIWSDARQFIASLYRRTDLSLRLAIYAVAIGVLLRVAWWATTVARVSFGPESGVNESFGPIFSWQCAQPLPLALGIVVMAMFVPIIEEIIHRGFVLRSTLRWGAATAILVSCIFFTVLHRVGSWPDVFVAGLVFALQFHRSGSLWPSTISHATYNLLVQFDWRCLHGKWLVADDELPQLTSGLVAVCTSVILLVAISVLIQKIPGARTRPGHSSTTERWRHAR